MACRGEGILKVSPAPARPIKIFNRVHTGTKFREGLSNRQIDMMSAWTIKIYSESFIENILPAKYLYGRNQCQVQFYKPFSSLQLNWDMKCILLG